MGGILYRGNAHRLCKALDTQGSCLVSCRLIWFCTRTAIWQSKELSLCHDSQVADGEVQLCLQPSAVRVNSPYHSSAAIGIQALWMVLQIGSQMVQADKTEKQLTLCKDQHGHLRAAFGFCPGASQY